MTTTDMVKQQVQQAALAGQSDQPTVFTLIKQNQKAIEMALPSHLSGDRFARIAMTLVRKTPKLLECEPMSFVGALMVSAQLGLEPGPPLGLSWIVPYWNKNTRRHEAEFQFGYKGIIKLFQQSGQFLSIKARQVCENDDFSFDDGLEDRLTHTWSLKEERGPAYAWYAIAKFRDGGHAFVVLDRAEVERRRARGQNGPAWRTDYDAMAMKSAIRALAPWLPLSPELERQLATDGQTFRTITPDLDDLPELEPGDDDDEASTPPAALASGGDGASTVETSPSGTIGNGSTEAAAGGQTDPPAPSVEDATGDDVETDPPTSPTAEERPSWTTKDEDQWSAAEWKDFLKTRGVTQADALSEARKLAAEFPGEKTPSGLADLKGQTRLCQLVRGRVEELSEEAGS